VMTPDTLTTVCPLKGERNLGPLISAIEIALDRVMEVARARRRVREAIAMIDGSEDEQLYSHHPPQLSSLLYIHCKPLF
jgi:hypothetical protein